MGAAENREEGLAFEALFLRQARRLGLLAIPNHLTCQRGRGGRIIVLKSELDFKLLFPGGGVGYFDCKSFHGSAFRYSDLDEKQIQRARLYNEWGVPSGFVVLFRAAKRVELFTGEAIIWRGPGNSFHAGEGVDLGPWHDFDLKKAGRQVSPTPAAVNGSPGPSIPGST